ncbi:hypothetical protein Tco_1365506, partial [Tanacetum coccineum]
AWDDTRPRSPVGYPVHDPLQPGCDEFQWLRLKLRFSVSWRGKLLYLQPWRMCPPFSIVYLSEPHSGRQENVGVSLDGDDGNLCIDEGLGQCHVLEFGGWYG